MAISDRIRKAVIPAAGLGTRFLPATKVIPKEMMPVAGRPLIQYAVEEAAASGIETVILVLATGKNLLASHFQRNVELENTLRDRGQIDEAEVIRGVSELADVQVVWQEEPLGLADAVRRTRPLVGDEAFAVLLPDALILSAVPCTRQLMTCYANHPGCIVATRKVEDSEVARFGIVEVVPLADRLPRNRVFRVTSLIERPDPSMVASRYGIFGRYILEPEIFEFIENTGPGRNGELQLTDSLLLCSKRRPMYAYCFEGQHYDAGNPLGFTIATIAVGLQDPELSQSLRQHLISLASIADSATFVKAD